MLRFIFILMLFYLNTAYSEQVKVGTINGEISCTNEGDAALFFNDMEVYIKDGSNTFSGVNSGNDYNGELIYFSIDGSYDSNLEITSEVNMFSSSSYQERDKFRTDEFFGKFSDKGTLEARAGNLYLKSGGCDIFIKLTFFPTNKPEIENKNLSPEVYINTNSQNIFKGERLQVFFNTSVPQGMTEKYDVYLSINWDDKIRYHNEKGLLVTKKQPLYEDIEVPEFSKWFEYKPLIYIFPEGVPQTDYVLGLHLVDSKDNVVFENFSSVSYFPKQSPFSLSDSSTQQSKARLITATTNQEAKGKSPKKCHLGGIRTDIENTVVTKLDKATKRSMLALQMGSFFGLTGKLKTLYQGAKGSYNILKKGKELCEKMDLIESLFNNYDVNIKDGLTSEQATDIFAMKLLFNVLFLTNQGAIYSNLDVDNLMNGVKGFYRQQNKKVARISALRNKASITIRFNQPFRWFRFQTKAVQLKVKVTPIFTYANGYEGKALKDIPKIKTTEETIKKASTNFDDKEIYSDSSAGSNKLAFLNTTLPRGLYLIKASTENGKEVYRDTIHVISEGQAHTMIINR